MTAHWHDTDEGGQFGLQTNKVRSFLWLVSMLVCAHGNLLQLVRHIKVFFIYDRAYQKFVKEECRLISLNSHTLQSPARARLTLQPRLERLITIQIHSGSALPSNRTGC